MTDIVHVNWVNLHLFTSLFFSPQAGDDLKGLGDDVHCQQIYMILTIKSEVNEMAKFQVITETIKKSPEFDKLSGKGCVLLGFERLQFGSVTKRCLR